MKELRLHAPLAGWSLPLSAVPDPVFADGMMGVGCAIDPIGDTLHAPCDGAVLTIHAAGHAITLATDAGAEVLIHLGIDTVAMKGDGFTALVAAGARVSAGDPLIRFDLDAVVQRASAAVTPVIVTSPGWRIATTIESRRMSDGDPLMTLVADAAPVAGPVATGGTLRRTMTIGLPHGLHARPAARIVAAARDAGVAATLSIGGREAACDSPTALLGLGASHGAAVTIAVTGAKAASAIDAIAALLKQEVDAPAPPPARPALPATPVADGAFSGVTAAPGLAIGAAHWLRNARPTLPNRTDDPITELARLMEGIEWVRQALATSAKAPGSAGAVMAAHAAILEDGALVGRAQALIKAGHSAAGAYLTTLEVEAEGLRRLPDRRIAERADDLIDVGYRVARAILGDEDGATELPDGVILLAEDLLPSQLIALDAARIAGIALVRGGPTSHVAILAAGIGVPMLVAIGERLHDVQAGATVLIDADGGYLHPAPDAALQSAAQATLATRRAAEARVTSGQTTTADGAPVAVFANLGSAADAAAAAAAGAEGCGLLRTEFLFLDRETAPDVAEQTASYSAIAQALGDRPLVIRLLDIGGDKPAPYLALAPEENPALGLRGIRVGLARPDVLEVQLRAILAMPEVARCRIMLPMVAGVGEVAAVRAALDRLGGGGVPLGVMIETPAAAITADLIGAHVDFMSIGSNDLTQYALAMDRGNAAVAAGIDGLHPAVLRLIAAACDGAARHGVPVSVCGGLAADPLAAPILVGLGVRTLSVPPARIAATKALVGALTIDAAAAHARAVIDLPTAGDIRAAARGFAQEYAA